MFQFPYFLVELTETVANIGGPRPSKRRFLMTAAACNHNLCQPIEIQEAHSSSASKVRHRDTR